MKSSDIELSYIFLGVCNANYSLFRPTVMPKLHRTDDLVIRTLTFHRKTTDAHLMLPDFS